jgi:tetratricopeptide (TPR) repeat protein
VAVLRPTGDEEALAFSLNLWGILQIQSGGFETAVQLLNECAALYRRADNPALLLKPLVNLSSVQMRLGNYDTAVAHLNEALPLAQEVGDLRGLTHIRNNLGANYLILGDLAVAYQQFAACLPLTAETAYQPVRLVVYQNLAEVSYKQGDWAQAIAHCEASLAIATEIGDAIQAIRTQKIYALALYAAGEPSRAWQILREAVAVGYEAAAMTALMDVLTGAAVLMVADGETAVVVDLLRFIVAHPATEQQYVQEAQALLARVSMPLE